MQKKQIVYAKTESIIPYINNPRNNEAAINAVAGSIAEFGFQVPIIVDENNVVVAGHTRLLAAQKLELKQVPIIVASELSEAQIKAYRIADNKVAEYSAWNDELLKTEFMQLQEMDIDLGITGFETWETDSYLKEVSIDDHLELYVPGVPPAEKHEKQAITCPNCGTIIE